MEGKGWWGEGTIGAVGLWKERDGGGRGQSEEYVKGRDNGPFSDDVTHTRKFDYYSVDHAWGGSTRSLMYYVLWGKPNQRTHSCV